MEMKWKKKLEKVIFKNGYLIWHVTSLSFRKNWVFLAGEMCEYQPPYFLHCLPVSVFTRPPFLLLEPARLGACHLSALLCMRATFHTSIHLHDPLLWGTTFWSCLLGPPENQGSLTAQTGFADRRRAKGAKTFRSYCVRASFSVCEDQ